MTEKKLRDFLNAHYPVENERCDWKEMENLKNPFNGHEGEDVMPYVSDLILLDKVQKKKRISDEKIRNLRKKKLVEERRNNLFLSRALTKNTNNVGLKSTYVKNKNFDDEYFRGLILQHVEKFGAASMRETDELLISKQSSIILLFVNTKERKHYTKDIDRALDFYVNLRNEVAEPSGSLFALKKEFDSIPKEELIYIKESGAVPILQRYKFI